MAWDLLAMATATAPVQIGDEGLLDEGLLARAKTSGKPTFYFIVLFHAFLCFWCFLKEKK